MTIRAAVLWRKLRTMNFTKQKKLFFETMGILAVMTGIYSAGLITRLTSLGLFSVVAGWLLCGFFLRVRWAPILMHGIYDTTAFLAIFFSLDKKYLAG